MLINEKTMMSPMASGPTLFNRLKANKGLTKALPGELWSLQTVSDDSCQDRCWLFLLQTLMISPKGGGESLYPCGLGQSYLPS